MAGKPDLAAVKNSDAVIIDAKTGRPSPYHAVQVMLHQHAVPKALEEYRGVEFRGHVAYTKSNVEIPISRIDTNFAHNLGAFNTTVSRRHAGPEGAELRRMQVLRYHHCRLPRTSGRTARHRHGHHRRLLGRRTPRAGRWGPHWQEMPTRISSQCCIHHQQATPSHDDKITPAPPPPPSDRQES